MRAGRLVCPEADCAEQLSLGQNRSAGVELMRAAVTGTDKRSALRRDADRMRVGDGPVAIAFHSGDRAMLCVENLAPRLDVVLQQVIQALVRRGAQPVQQLKMADARMDGRLMSMQSVRSSEQRHKQNRRHGDDRAMGQCHSFTAIDAQLLSGRVWRPKSKHLGGDMAYV